MSVIPNNVRAIERMIELELYNVPPTTEQQMIHI